MRQYLREDYIEKNNVIFELSKAHNLDTTKAINHVGQSPKKKEDQPFNGGLYTIGASHHMES